jgi:hypothetical protein
MKFLLLTDLDGDKVVIGFGSGGCTDAWEVVEKTNILGSSTRKFTTVMNNNTESEYFFEVQETPEEIYKMLKE